MQHVHSGGDSKLNTPATQRRSRSVVPAAIMQSRMRSLIAIAFQQLACVTPPFYSHVLYMCSTMQRVW